MHPDSSANADVVHVLGCDENVLLPVRGIRSVDLNMRH